MILRDYLEESKKKGVILAQPVHGKHSEEPKSINGVILVQPVHGKHSRPPKGETNEEYENKYAINPEGQEHHIDFGAKNYNDHLGKEVNDVHKKLDLHPDKFGSNPHARALGNYTISSHVMNKELINKAADRPSRWEHNKFDTPEEKVSKTKREEKFHNDVSEMDKSFKHPNARLEHDVHVFHGTRHWNPGHEAAKNGGRIHLPAYTSTSINANQALDFADAGQSHSSHVIHIHMKKGQKGHYLGSNSAVPEEQEMLLPRNTTLRIHPKPTILHNGLMSDKKVHVWHGHIEE